MLEIERACFPEEHYTEEVFRRYHERCPDLFIVVKRLGRIAGYMITCVEPDHAEVISIAVHPVWQRKGLGNRLLQHTIERLSGTDVVEVRLMVRESSEPARELYRRFGFVQTGQVKAYYQDGSDAVRMARKLL